MTSFRYKLSQMGRTLRRFAVIAVFTLSFASAQAGDEYFQYNGKQRHMITYAPKGLPEAPALLISLHGMNQDAAYQKNQCNWESVADTAKFVVVYPDGIDKSWDISGNSDVDYILYIMDMMNERYNCDMNRVYLSGFSMGAMMCYHTASKAAEKFAAIAPVSGYNMSLNASSTCEIPVFHTHGTADDVCTYDPVPGYIEKWVKINKCDPTPEVYNPYPADKPAGNCTLKIWSGGTNGVEVALLTLPGKGHWHSLDNNGANTSKEIWNFVKRFSRGPAAALPPKVVEAFPDTSMFDIPDHDFQLRYVFSEAVKVSGITATLASSVSSVKLVPDQTAEYDSIITYTISDKLLHGSYTLTLQSITGRRGGTLRRRIYNFSVGVNDYPYGEEVVYNADWKNQIDTLGECIPDMWRRSDKGSIVSKITPANKPVTEGSRLISLADGGDFSTGFYLSAENNASSSIQLGMISDNRLSLKPGICNISFNSINWNENATFDVAVYRVSGNKLIKQFSGLSSYGTLNSKPDAPIGSKLHELSLELDIEGEYSIYLTTASGKGNGLVIGNFKVTQSPNIQQSYRYSYVSQLELFRSNLLALQAPQFDESSSLRSSMKERLARCEGYEGHSADSYKEIIDELTAGNRLMTQRMANVTELDSIWALSLEIIARYEGTEYASLSAYSKLKKKITRSQDLSKTDDTQMRSTITTLSRYIQEIMMVVPSTDVEVQTLLPVSILYIGLDGKTLSGRPQSGMCIVRTIWSDGSVTTRTQLISE